MTIEPFKMRVTPEQIKILLDRFYGKGKYAPHFLKFRYAYMSKDGWPGFGETEELYQKDTRIELTYEQFIQKYEK